MATMLFTASCQQEELVKQPQAGDLAKVSIKVTTPELGAATRAFGDGKSAMDLHYAVYNVKTVDGKEELTYLPELTVEDHEIDIKTTVDLQLVTGNTYKVIFWADNENAPYTTNWENAENPTVTVNYDGVTSNNENYDAFFNWMTIDVDAAKTVDIDLYRPFAQLNIGTSDIVEASKAGYTLQKTQVTVQAYETLNLWAKTVADPTEVVFSAADYPNYDVNADYGLNTTASDYETFPVPGYEYMAMNYLLCPADKELVDVKFDFFAFAVNGNGEAKERKYASVPVQRNWRTNIYGQLITSDVDVKVEIVPGFENAYNIKVWDGHTLTAPQVAADGTILVGQGSDLAYIANVLNGGDQSNAANSRTRAGSEDYTKAKIVLTNNIDLGGENWNPINGFKGEFDGQGFTISNLNVSTEGKASAGLFANLLEGTVKNLKVKDADIKGHYKTGVIVGDGLCALIENCEVENAKVVVTPYNNDDANHVGGIVGYLSAENDAYVKDCTVKNAEITAYRDVAGVVGTANGAAVVTGNTAVNVKVTAERRCDYVEEKAYNAGAIVGRVHESATVESNTATDVTVEVYEKNGVEIKNGVYYVGSQSELAYVLGLNLTGDVKIVFDDHIEGTVTEIQKAGRNLIIDGADKSYNGSIKVHSNSYYYADAALTVKNVNFTTSVASTNFIEALENGSERYSSNITVENCTFTATGEAVNTAVGVQVKATRGVTVKNCTATNMHSLIQAQSCDTGDVKVVNCTVNGKNGVAFKQVKSATVEGTTITALEYGIRFDGNIDNYGITVKDNNVSAVQPFIVRKMTGANNTIALEGTNDLKATSKDGFQIVITKGSDDETYAKPTGTYTLTGADSYTVYPRDYFYPVASWDDFSALLATGETKLKLTADISYDANYQLQKAIILDLNGKSMTLPMVNIHTATTVKNGTINGKVYARKNSDIVFDNVKFSGAVADNFSTEGHLAIQGGCKRVYAKNCLFSPTSVSGSQTKPLSFEGGSSILKFEGCEFKSSPYKTQVYLNSLSATGSIDFTNCNFNNKTPNIMLAATCPFTNVTMSGTTKLSSVTFETNRAKEAVTADDLAYLRTLIANNSISSVRLFYAGGSSEYIR